MKIAKICRGALSVMVVILTIALTSCVKESLPDGGEFGDGYADLTLKLVSPGAFSEVQTRALPDEQQNAINRAVVFICKDGIIVQKVNAEKVINNVMTIKGIKTSHSENDKYDVVVIGNPSSDIDMTNYIGKTKEELRKSDRMAPYYDGRWNETEFPMWGEATQVYVHPISNTFQIKMLRALARIDLGVGPYDELTDKWGGLSNFKLSEITLKTLTTLIDIIPKPENIDLNGKAINVSSRGKMVGMSTEGKYSGADITDRAYIKSTIFLAETESLLANPVTLIIGGNYGGGSRTYYRVDMCLPDERSPGTYKDMNILRNHLYRISITSVSGPGYTSIAEAATAPALNNIAVELNPIDEGGSGDIIFDSHSSIVTDVSDVIIYGKTPGLTTVTIATVKANFEPGVTTARILGSGIVSPIGTLISGNATPVVIDIASMSPGSARDYTIVVGTLKKMIRVMLAYPVDAHFDFRPFRDVARIQIENPQPWITLSNNRTYVKQEQQSEDITGDENGKAVFHFDENSATTGNPRTARALVFRTSSRSTTRVIFEQLNLKGMLLGYFGGAKDNQGYTKQLAVESVEEFNKSIYDDTSVGSPVGGMLWGFNNVFIGIIDKEFGRLSTMTLAKTKFAQNGVVATEAALSVYNNYAARYCYDKNRDKNGNGYIDATDDPNTNEMIWYLPAQNQLMAAWIANAGLIIPFTLHYWCSTEFDAGNSWYGNFDLGFTGQYLKTPMRKVRCVRDI